MSSSRAFTLIELLAILAALSILSVFTIAQPDKKSREANDDRNLRGIGQALIVWANNNGDSYPLPSAVDKLDATIAGGKTSKNTSSNIYSLLVFNGSLAHNILISPLETNPNITQCMNYEFANPKAADVPERALWDPAFSADFTKAGHASYAHQQPSDKRLPRWSASFSTSDIAVGNRGPEITGISREVAGTISPLFASPPIPAPEGSPEGTPAKGTRTCSFHGDGTTWTGHLVYNDNSIRPLRPGLAHTRPIPFTGLADFPTYTVDNQSRPDLPFYDEPDDMKESNNFIGIFTEAGTTRKAFKAIWD